METVAGHVRALREGDDAAKTAAVRALGDLAYSNENNKVLIAEAGGIPPLVDLLRNGNAEAKLEAARALCNLAFNNAANKVLIAEAGAIPPLVELVRDGSAEAKLQAAGALHFLARNYDNKALIAEAGGIAPLVDLLRNGSAEVGKLLAADALYEVGGRGNNHANAVAIAVTVGIEALLELARRGSVTVDVRRAFTGGVFSTPSGVYIAIRPLVLNAGIPAKRKAALVVAALLEAAAPRTGVPRVLKAEIGSYL